MAGTKLEIRTADGVADCLTFQPEGSGPWPGVLYLMDAVGVRPAFEEMAQRLADAGYFVLAPNLFYRSGTFTPPDPKTMWTDPTARERIMKVIGALDNAAVLRDGAAYLDALEKHPSVRRGKVGAAGYCMGGRLALFLGGSMPERIGAVGAFHAGHVVNDKPDSAHLVAKNIKGRVYVGGADTDPSFTPEHKVALERALSEGGVPHEVEIIAGAKHGYAMPDLPVYDPKAAEHHWQKLLGLFGETLQRA